MSNTRTGDKTDLYNSNFAATLRDLMEKNGTTQKELAKFVEVRPQTISLYCTGETQPTVDKALRIAEFFHVSVDYLMTGNILEDIPAREMLGLSQETIECLKLVKDGYFEDSPYILPLIDALLRNKDFYQTMDKAAKFKAAAAGQDDEHAQFYEWKAAQVLQDFLLEFLAHNFNIINQ